MASETVRIWEYGKRTTGAPSGYPFAVTCNKREVAWTSEESLAELFCWVISFTEEIESKKNQEFIELVMEFFSRLRGKG